MTLSIICISLDTSLARHVTVSVRGVTKRAELIN